MTSEKSLYCESFITNKKQNKVLTLCKPWFRRQHSIHDRFWSKIQGNLSRILSKFIHFSKMAFLSLFSQFLNKTSFLQYSFCYLFPIKIIKNFTFSNKKYRKIRLFPQFIVWWKDLVGCTPMTGLSSSMDSLSMAACLTPSMVLTIFLIGIWIIPCSVFSAKKLLGNSDAFLFRDFPILCRFQAFFKKNVSHSAQKSPNSP